MQEMKVEFKVAMDAEQAKLKNHETVTFTVTFPEGCEAQVQKDALAHSVVKWQSQIRGNWTKFIENGVPEKITYGAPIYGSSRSTIRPPTEKEVEDFMAKKIALLNEDGMKMLVTTGKLPEGEQYYK